MRIAIVGGTGKEGRGLARRWAAAGHEVRIGSRDDEKARQCAKNLTETDPLKIDGGSNAWAIESAEVVVLSIPYSAHGETVRALKSQLGDAVIIDITVPLRPPRVTEVNIPPGHSAALEMADILGKNAPIAATLHHVSATHLADPGHAFESDALVCADSERAKAVAMTLVGDLGLRPLDGGPLRNAIALEALTPLLLHLGKRYGHPGVGVRFVGIP